MADAPGALGAVVLLTFSHQITDGRGALRAAHDLLTLIGGRLPPARPLPVAQETSLERMPSTVEPEGSPTAVASSPRGAATLRPFDASPPNVEVAQLDYATTERLRVNARAHAATVQGALCAAAAQALSKLTGAESIRINAPIDLRSALSLEDGVVNRFTSTTVVLQSPADDSLWTLAQDATAQLRVARAAARETALMLASLDPVDPVGAVEAEAAMLTATDADLEITNLGISNAGTPSAVAIWGPIMTTQVRDERILGAITHGGRLRLVLTTHRDSEALAATIADLLA
ncbi:hypothetical protein R4P64_33385 [Rhodococcus sp. IEGM 1366]|uniref:phthiocerol/phthiodiolone dimycocerosyl transferase family protein n=1 Tax=Rhodococcus sp. IEGM 1366 TaxID=3082223 RepID=UPI00295346F0|nr:hypothetical protein [Rhodococcus sp. IEGM 1366]MDV8071407.1 hypothetical protein [Rhodococcus sp. IEGM 1366]